MPFQYWSKKLNVHFGYFRWSMNPFDREAMLSGMNTLVGSLLGLPFGKNCTVLDLGCGFGATIRELQGQFPKARFTGVNHEPAQVSTALRQCPTASFHLASFENMLPFRNARFDAAYAIESACFAEGEAKGNLLREAARVLTDEGRLVVVDAFLRHGRPLPYPISRLYQHCTEAWGMSALPVLPRFLQVLEEQGFVDIKIQDISWRVAPSLLHAPWVCGRLSVAYFAKRNPAVLRYAKALLLTLSLAPFRKHYCYLAVTCRKRSAESGK